MASTAPHKQQYMLSRETKLHCAFYDTFYTVYSEGLEKHPLSITSYLGNIWEDAVSIRRQKPYGISSCKDIVRYALRIAKNHTILERMAEEGSYDRGLAAMLLADMQYSMHQIRSRG